MAFISKLTDSFLSVCCIRKKSLEIVFLTDACNTEVEIVLVVEKASGWVVMKGIEGEHGLYEMLLTPERSSNNAGKLLLTANQVDWHGRFAHAPCTEINRTASLVTGIKKVVEHLTSDCEAFMENKSTRVSRKQADNTRRSNREPLNLVHSDYCGPIGIPLVGKAKYFVTLYYGITAVSIIRFIQNKDQTGGELKSMIL